MRARSHIVPPCHGGTTRGSERSRSPFGSEPQGRRPHRPSKSYSRPASVYVLVITSSTLLAIMGLGALTATRIQQRNISGTSDFSEARVYARSAIELGLRFITSDTNWRTTWSNGNWKTNQTIGKGTYTLNVVDPNDGNLSNSNNDPVVLTGIGMKGVAKHQLSVTVTSTQVGYTCLQTAMHANGNITFPGSGNAVQQAGRIVSSNGTVTSSGADIYCNVEAVGSITGSTYRGTSTTPVTARTMPGANVFDYYNTNGTAISFSSIPRNNGDTTIEKVVISPSSNPYPSGGTTNSQGIYVINCGGQKIIIQNCRIVGTLYLINPESDSSVQGSVLMESVTGSNLPCLLVNGSMQININNNSLSESSLNTNFNPTGTPYLSVSNATKTDTYPSIIKGLVYLSGALTTSNYVTVNGALVSGSTLSTSGTIDLTYDSRFYNTPPPGFETPPKYTIQAGAWKQTVN